MLPLCRSRFTGFSWQFISLSLSFSSGAHAEHISLSPLEPCPQTHLVPPLSHFLSFFELGLCVFTTPPTLLHASYLHFSLFTFSPLMFSLHLSSHTASAFSSHLHQFPPHFLFSSRPRCISLTCLVRSLDFCLTSGDVACVSVYSCSTVLFARGCVWVCCMSLCLRGEIDVTAACVHVWVFVRSSTGSCGQRVLSLRHNATNSTFWKSSTEVQP